VRETLFLGRQWRKDLLLPQSEREYHEKKKEEDLAEMLKENGKDED